MKTKLLLKIITLLLVASTLFASIGVLAACESTEAGNEEQASETKTEVESLNIGIVADPHVAAEMNYASFNMNIVQKYIKEQGVFRMMAYSEAILKASVDNLIEMKPDVAFVIGDLTEKGDLNSLQVVAEQCARLEAAGIPTFVANGLTDVGVTKAYSFPAEKNHPKIATVTDESFAATMSNFGYGEALSRDENSLSYVADIPGTNYRVMMVDSTKFTDSGRKNVDMRVNLINAKADPLPEGQIEWIKQSLAEAQKYNKEIIVFSSIPVNEKPVSYFNEFVKGAYISMDDGATLENLFTEYGVKYFFNGHVHLDNTLEVETDHGTIVEESTACLCSYPCTIKQFSINTDNTYSITKSTITNFNGDYLADEVTEEDKLAITTDFAAFAKQFLLNTFTTQQYDNVFSTSQNGIPLFMSIMTELTIYPTGDAEKDAALEQIGEDCTNWMLDVNKLQIYGEGNTVEGLLAPYGYTVPDSKYRGMTVKEYILDLFIRMNDGSYQNGNSLDNDLMKDILYAGLLMVVPVDFMTRLHEINNLVLPCDFSVLTENFMTTGTANLKDDEFLLSMVSAFFPYMKEYVPWLNINITSSEQLLKSINLIIPVITEGLPELRLFGGSDGSFETNYMSLSKGEIYGDALVSEIILPVMVRTSLTI